MNEDQKWMSEALECAQRAQEIGEVPIGAVCVRDSKIISYGWNQCITQCDPSAHAEIVALREAAKKLGNYRLLDVDLYVTLEPCFMCAGAIVHSRINRLIYAAYDLKTGVIDSKMKFFNHPILNHRPGVTSGVMEAQASDLLSTFFKNKRRSKKL